MYIDKPNPQGIALRGDVIYISSPRVRMTREEALLLAAWLVALADPMGDRFEDILEAVQNT